MKYWHQNLSRITMGLGTYLRVLSSVEPKSPIRVHFMRIRIQLKISMGTHTDKGNNADPDSGASKLFVMPASGSTFRMWIRMANLM